MYHLASVLTFALFALCFRVQAGTCLGDLIDVLGQSPKVSLIENGDFQGRAFELADQGLFVQARSLEYEIEVLLKEGVFTTGSRLGGRTGARRLIYEENSLFNGVFKARDRLSLFSRYQSEVAAYEIDRLFNFWLVPVTTVRTQDGQLGSVQAMLNHNAIHGVYFKQSNSHRAGHYMERYHQITFFDYLIQTGDRRGSDQIIVLADGIDAEDYRLVAIDHGVSFRIDPNNIFQSITPLSQTGIDWYFRKEIPNRVIERLVSVTNDEIRQAAGHLISARQMRRLLGRRQLLKNYILENPEKFNL